MSEMVDYFAAEQRLISQLKQHLTTVPVNHIFSVADLDGVKAKKQIVPSVTVMVMDDNPMPSSGVDQLVDQHWAVVVSVRNVNDQSGEQARKKAGPIVSEVIQTLHLFKPGHPYTPFTRIKSPYRATWREGFFYFPLLFKTRFSTQGFSG